MYVLNVLEMYIIYQQMHAKTMQKAWKACQWCGKAQPVVTTASLAVLRRKMQDGAEGMPMMR